MGGEPAELSDADANIYFGVDGRPPIRCPRVSGSWLSGLLDLSWSCSIEKRLRGLRCCFYQQITFTVSIRAQGPCPGSVSRIRPADPPAGSVKELPEGSGVRIRSEDPCQGSVLRIRPKDPAEGSVLRIHPKDLLEGFVLRIRLKDLF